MWKVNKEPVLKPLKMFVLNENPAWREGFISLIRGTSTSPARTVHPEMKHFPRSQVISGLAWMICPKSPR